MLDKNPKYYVGKWIKDNRTESGDPYMANTRLKI